MVNALIKTHLYLKCLKEAAIVKQKIHQVNAGENEQRIEIYKCIQNQRLTEIRSSHFPIFLVKWDLQWSLCGRMI